MSSRLQRAWLTRGPLACALWPVSLLYRLLLNLRRWLYRCGWWQTEQLPVPVIVVGNVVVGGAGKTPTVIALVEHLRLRGWTPGVISRGHGRQADGCLEVSASTPSTEAGDEPVLIRQATEVPLVVGRNRVQAARSLLQAHPEIDVIVSDDGMQHWALARDLTVVVFDERGTGNGWLLPAGLLREPWPTQPWGVGELLVLRTQRGNTTSALPALRSEHTVYAAHRELAACAYNAQGERMTLSEWASQHATHARGAFAGIAQPQVFFDMLTAQGVELQHHLPLPDHASAAEIRQTLPPDIAWLCTEKDAVKLFRPPNNAHADVWAVPLQQNAEPAFWQALDRALERLSSAHGRQTP